MEGLHCPRTLSHLESCLEAASSDLPGQLERWPAGRGLRDPSPHPWGLSLGTQASGISHHVPQRDALLITNPRGHLPEKGPSVATSG